MDTATWKRTLNMIRGIALGLLAIVLVYGSIYTVSEQERAVITQFGKVVDEQGAGLHFKIPFVQNVRKVNMTTQGMEFGYSSSSGHDVSIESESVMITKDFNFVNVDFYVVWQVTQPAQYLYNSADPEGLLRNILQSEARSIVSSYDVDDVLTTAKVDIQTSVRDGVQTKLDEYAIGMYVSNVSLLDAEPPTAEIVAAFKNVENAKQNKDTEINIAKTYANQVIPQARADADRIMREAEGIREARINEATGQTARFNAMFSEYIRNKDITKTRMYLETMEEIMPGTKTIIDSSDITKIMDLNRSAEPDTVRNAAVDAASQPPVTDIPEITEGGGGYEN